MHSILFAALLGTTLASTSIEAHPITTQEFLTITRISDTCNRRYPEPSIVKKIFYGSQVTLERREKIAICLKNEMAKANLHDFTVVSTGNN